MTARLQCPLCQHPADIPGGDPGEIVYCQNCDYHYQIPIQSMKDDDVVANAIENPGEVQWLCKIDGEVLGPIAFVAVKQLFKAGTLTLESALQPAGSKAWIPASRLSDKFKKPKRKKSGISESERKQYTWEASWQIIIGVVVGTFLIVLYFKYFLLSQGPFSRLVRGGLLVCAMVLGRASKILWDLKFRPEAFIEREVYGSRTVSEKVRSLALSRWRKLNIGALLMCLLLCPAWNLLYTWSHPHAYGFENTWGVSLILSLFASVPTYGLVVCIGLLFMPNEFFDDRAGIRILNVLGAYEGSQVRGRSIVVIVLCLCLLAFLAFWQNSIF